MTRFSFPTPGPGHEPYLHYTTQYIWPGMVVPWQLQLEPCRLTNDGIVVLLRRGPIDTKSLVLHKSVTLSPGGTCLRGTLTTSRTGRGASRRTDRILTDRLALVAIDG